MKKYILAYLILILAIASRFVPHMANAAPITALAIFAAAYLPARRATFVVLLVRFVSDVFLGFFAWPLMVAVYAAHLFGILLGLWIKNSGGSLRWGKIILSGALSSAVFFFVTNFAFLYAPTEYPHTLPGVLLAYTNGLPFLRGTLLGDVGYTLGLFVLYALASYFVSSRAKRAPAFL
jgi:hypothetical protein